MISVFGDATHPELDGTRQWRLEWWRDIVEYTVMGPHFWTGKGFGINLSVDDRFETGADPPLRSPHSGHFTILARSGVPGFVLWTLVQGAFVLGLLRSYRRARNTGRLWWARIDLWLLAWWSAFMINAAFDVFLEGPQGGIWFWSVIGLGIAAIETQHREFSGDPG